MAGWADLAVGTGLSVRIGRVGGTGYCCHQGPYLFAPMPCVSIYPLSLSLYIYMHLYIYIYIHIYIYIYIYMCVCSFVSLSLSLSSYVHIHLYLYLNRMHFKSMMSLSIYIYPKRCISISSYDRLEAPRKLFEYQCDHLDRS